MMDDQILGGDDDGDEKDTGAVRSSRFADGNGLKDLRGAKGKSCNPTMEKSKSKSKK